MDRRLRLDLTDQLTYWFKPGGGDVLGEMTQALQTASISGTKPDYMLGDDPCVAFTETPLAIAAKLLANAGSLKLNYAPVGFLFERKWLFLLGARPVIYQTAKEAAGLAAEQRYRHVTLDLEQGIDFTWKREWRIRLAQLTMEPAFVRPVLPSQAWLEQMRQNVATTGIATRLLAKAVVLDTLL